MRASDAVARALRGTRTLTLEEKGDVNERAWCFGGVVCCVEME
jgi:hypothetical protein